MAFNGKFKLYQSEKFEEYMQALGVGLATRKLAATATPVQTITQNGDDFTIKTATSFKTSEIAFTVGKEFDETTADGRKCKTTASLDGNKLTLLQKGDKESTQVREVNGSELVMTLKVDNVTCVRKYKKE